MRSMRHGSQRERKATPTRRYAVEQSEVVGQILWADVARDQVSLDVLPSSVRHPSGRSTMGAPFTLTARLPSDPMWRSLLSGVLRKWADEGETLGLDLFLEDRKVVRLCSAEAMMRLDLQVPEDSFDDAEAS
jgi:hypothetical protein